MPSGWLRQNMNWFHSGVGRWGFCLPFWELAVFTFPRPVSFRSVFSVLLAIFIFFCLSHLFSYYLTFPWITCRKLPSPRIHPTVTINGNSLSMKAAEQGFLIKTVIDSAPLVLSGFSPIHFSESCYWKLSALCVLAPLIVFTEAVLLVQGRLQTKTRR